MLSSISARIHSATNRSIYRLFTVPAAHRSIAKRLIASLTALSATAAFTTSAFAVPRIAFIRTTANLHNAPDADSDSKAALRAGRRARVLDTRGNWLKIRLQSGTEGWILKDTVAVNTDDSTALAKSHRNGSFRLASIGDENSREAEQRRLFDAKMHAAVTNTLYSVSAPQKKAVVKPEGAVDNGSDPRIATAPVASSITMEMEGTTTENGAPVNSSVANPENGSDAPISRNSTRANRIMRDALAQRGTPYRFGATGHGAFDCSGFTQYIYSKSGVDLPRTASEQFRRGIPVPKDQLRTGDLVFFKNTYKAGVSHVGVYLGNGQFVHASSGGHEVKVSDLSGSYYQNHWAGARRPVQ